MNTMQRKIEDRDKIIKIGRKGLVEQKRLIFEALLSLMCIKYDIIKYDLVIDDTGHCTCNIWNKEIHLSEDYFNYKKIFDNHIADYLSVNLLSDLGKMLFIFFHEIGHAIQYERHQQWFHLFRQQKDNHLSMHSDYSMYESNRREYMDGKYRECKLESNADKIAICFMNKYYPELIEKK